MTDILQELRDYQRQLSDLDKTMTLAEYLPMVIANPKLASLAHQRIADMIIAAGREYDEKTGRYHYKFFQDDLFGADDAVGDVVKYFESAGPGSEVSRRILLLYGPPSSGKSQLAILLKRGLEKYTATLEGAVYAIADSPMHENPLLLLPATLRDKLHKDHGIYVEGELSPAMVQVLQDRYDGDMMKVPIKRILFSERDRIGITTFLPSDTKSQDISELTGSLNLAKIGEYGVESDPRAFSFDGSLNKANRGMVEFIEMLKTEPKFLYVLLTLSQEKNIKVGRFPLIYCDEVVMAHTNESEFRNFYGNKEMEAFHDRIITVRMGYNLQLNEEVKIYKKLLLGADLRGAKFSPHALEMAAMFAVATRLTQSRHEGLTLQKKIKIYNGQEVEGFSQADLKKIREENKREGMDGVSPRYIINVLSSCAVLSPKSSVITPLTVIRALKDNISLNTQINDKQKELYIQLLIMVSDEYAAIARKDVKKAFFVNFQDEIHNLLSNYIDNIKAYLDGSNIKDPITGEEIPPKEELMREVEQHIGISDNAKDEWRNEICRKMLGSKAESGVYDYKRHTKLQQALEEQMFKERSDIIRLTVSSRNPDEKELRKINEVIDKLISEYGYCKESANELLKFVNSIMNKRTQ